MASLRILVIDDNPDVADSLVMLMESLSVEVRVAYDGTSGVESGVEFCPDIVSIGVRVPTTAPKIVPDTPKRLVPRITTEQ